MSINRPVWASPIQHICSQRPEEPVLYFAPQVLHATARRFLEGFPGLVTYAVKANASDAVIAGLSTAGIGAFDVASVAEIEQVRRLAPEATLHFNNPVRAQWENRRALALGVRSFSIDSFSELDKLAQATAPAGVETSIRLALPVRGAAYDFGAKFGANPDRAAELLARAAAYGFTPSITFHPGTQCTDPQAWVRYIEAAAEVADAAGVRLARLNVGGGFPAWRGGEPPALEPIFAAIGSATARAFGTDAPALVCEPGRAMVAEAFAVATRVRAVRDGDDIFLNDGIYGSLAEMAILGPVTRAVALRPDGTLRRGAALERRIFGPTCDSLDILPEGIALPADLAEGDYVIFHGMGAYSTATATRFNGFGACAQVTVLGWDTPARDLAA